MTPAVSAQLTRAVLDQAVESLANLHQLMCVDDPGVRLRVLSEIDRELHINVALAAVNCHRHGYTPAEITKLLNHPPPT